MKKLKSPVKWLGSIKRSRLISASVFVVLFAAIGTAVLLSSFAAGSPSIYVTPVTGSVQTGSDVTVSLRINPGTDINAVDATLTYDQTKLQFKSIDTSASGFASIFISTGGNGKVNIVAGVQGSTVTGDLEIGKVTFTALGSTAGTTALTTSGQAAKPTGDAVTLVYTGSTISVTTPGGTTHTSAFTIEPTTTTPVIGTQFGLKVYANSDAFYQVGEVIVNLPAGVTYSGTLDTTGTPFTPAQTVNGTTPQSVDLVFATQSTTLTGKQLVATIPVTSTTAGAKSITMTKTNILDASGVAITPLTANPLSVNVGSAALSAPVVTIAGKTQIAATEDVKDLKQAFSITNFDSAATYVVTLGGQTLTVSGSGAFSIPATVHNGNLALQVTATKSGTSGSASYTIRLRSPNVDRLACVDLADLYSVNKAYGKASTDNDLNFDGTVSLIDLVTVTGAWGGACV